MEAAGLVGRAGELDSIDRLLGQAHEGWRALVLEGEPGIGKTTVWRAGLERAAERGMTVLACRPVEAEAKLAFASLADLVAPVVDATLPALPEPQRLALEVALLRTTPTGARVDGRAVGTAAHSLLRAVSAEAPVLVAIDDLQWLDKASASALVFALRRVDQSPIRLLAAVRVDASGHPVSAELERAAPESVERLRLEPLSLSALHHIIQTQLGQALPRPSLQRVARTSRGNPLFALELARALVESNARPVSGAPLPVPETLATLLAERVRRLSAPVREVLLAASALSTPEAALVRAALGRDVDDELAAIERADAARVRDGRIQFSHPLLASAIYAAASVDDLRIVHRALAGVVSEPEQRARHLALASEHADEHVAETLDAAARGAAARGAPEAAVELAELACRLTPPELGGAYAERRLALADHVFRAGDTDEAGRLVRDLVDELPPSPLRARARELLARVLHVAGTAVEAAAECEQALHETRDDRVLEAHIHATLALVAWHDFDLARAHAHRAVELLDELDEPDPAVLSQALMAYAQAEFYTGHELPAGIVARGLELERVAPAPSVADRLSAALGAWLKYQGDFAEARRWLDATYEAAVEEGDEGSLAYVLSHRPQLELWTGNWAEAERAAREHLELAEQTRQPGQRRQALCNLANVHTHLGRVDEARAEAEELLHEAEAAADAWDESNARATLGLLELSLGRAAEAAVHLSRNLEIREGLGNREPTRAYADYAEVLVELGDLDRAGDVASALDEQAQLTRRVPQLAVAATARAIVAAGKGDLDAATAALEEAIAYHEQATVPFDLARTLVALGQVQRRRGERRAARQTLERACAIFGELGAPEWKARAETELRRIPIRRGASTDLTGTEEQVAMLAASGRTNREVAQTLFMSPKTVEVNLTRIYRKLGIASRAELGARMAERNRQQAAPKP
jgi:DNA-binding CsgD family transcriptional regulator